MGLVWQPLIAMMEGSDEISGFWPTLKVFGKGNRDGWPERGMLT